MSTDKIYVAGHRGMVGSAIVRQLLAQGIDQSQIITRKRVAFAAADVFLRINGWRLHRAPMQIHDELIQMFESGTFDFAHSEPWLRGFAEPSA